MRAEKLETEIRQEQIAQAALHIVATQGIKALTVERIARLVGVVPSALYRHYKSKAQLMLVILDTFGSHLMGMVKEARKGGGSPLEIIKRLLLLHVRLAMQNRAAPRIFFSDEVLGGGTAGKARLKDIFGSFLGEITALMKEGQEQGTIRRDFPPEALAVQYFGLFVPAGLMFQLSEGEFDMAKQAEIGWKLFVKGLQPS